MNDTFWRLLTTPAAVLAADWGVSVAEVRRMRRVTTGCTKPIGETWAPAFGCWGGVQPLAEVARRTGTSHGAVRDYAKGMGLRLASSHVKRTHAELAVLLYVDRRRPAAESCRAYGVLPAERHLLCTYLETLLRDARLVVSAVLLWSPERLEQEWAGAGFSMEPPPYAMPASERYDPGGLVSMEASDL